MKECLPDFIVDYITGIMKSTFLLPPFLAIVAPTTLAFLVPDPELFRKIEVHSTYSHNKDGDVYGETSSFIRSSDDDGSAADRAYTDAIFNSIQDSLIGQVRAVESRVKQFQDELKEKMESLSLGWEHEATGDLGEFYSEDPSLETQEWANELPRVNTMNKASAIDIALQEPQAKEEALETAGFYGLEAWDTLGWLDTADRQIPVDVSVLDETFSEYESYFTLSHHSGQIQRKGFKDTSKTLWQLIESSKHASSFYEFVKDFPNLVDRLNGTYSDSSNITVFIPTNKAFEETLRGKDKADIPKDLIEKVLTYHFIDGYYTSDDLKWYNTVESLLPNSFSDSYSNQRLRLGYCPKTGSNVNIFSRVIMADIRGKNGVIHAVSKVILPPPTIRTIMNFLPTKFSTTIAALSKTGLMEKLDNAPNTVFAPLNTAWERLPTEITAFLFSEEGQKYLEAIMKYHIVPDEVVYSDAAIKYPIHDTENDRTESFPAGYTHHDFPTMLTTADSADRGFIHMDTVRFPKFLSYRVNGRSEIIVANGIAKDGVLHVPNHLFIPTCSELHGEGNFYNSFADRHAQIALGDVKKRVPCKDIESLESLNLETFKNLWDGLLEMEEEARRFL